MVHAGNHARSTLRTSKKSFGTSRHTKQKKNGQIIKIRNFIGLESTIKKTVILIRVFFYSTYQTIDFPTFNSDFGIWEFKLLVLRDQKELGGVQ